MKKLWALGLLVCSSGALAGGTIGGGGSGVALEMATEAFDVHSLPKAFAEADDLRRAAMRLSSEKTDSIALEVTEFDSGEPIKKRIQVKLLRGSIVNLLNTVVILPSE